MAVTGDFTRLRQLQDRLRAMAAGEAAKELRHELANETHRLVIDSFATKRDPYGHTWKPRAQRTGWAALAFGLPDTHPLLDKTGALINSVKARAVGIGVRVTMLWYGVFHWQPDRPDRKIPQRTMLPTKRQGLGPIWTTAFLRISSAVARRFARL